MGTSFRGGKHLAAEHLVEAKTDTADKGEREERELNGELIIRHGSAIGQPQNRSKYNDGPAGEFDRRRGVAETNVAMAVVHRKIDRGLRGPVWPSADSID